jgi:UDP-glucose/galactose:(glucosyl)LPS alpha-1,2-glucosyl/galactosyltransferase
MEINDIVRKRESLNLAITFDNNYQKWATVCLHSVFKTYKGTAEIRLFILSDLDYKNFIPQLKNILRNFEFSIDVIGNAFDDLPTGFHFTKAMYGLLAMPGLLSKKGIKKALYIDLDIIVLEDLNQLYSINLSEYFCAGALDIHTHNEALQTRLNLKQGFVINSGVILMNIEKMNEINWIEKANKLNIQGKIRWGDQDVVNMLMDGKIIKLEQKWNVQSGNFQNGYEGDVSVVHFTESGNTKPWHWKAKHPYLGVYHIYIRESGFYWDYFRFELVRRLKKLVKSK